MNRNGHPHVALEGGCQCGRIRYRANGSPIRTSICHCRMCQLASGGPFMVFVRFLNADLAWSTPPEIFASSNLVERGFCRRCGTPLSYREIEGANISVTLGSLDDPDAVSPPEVSFSTARRAGWLDRLATLPTQEADLTTDSAFVSHQGGSD